MPTKKRLLHVDLRNWDPAQPIEYLDLITRLLRSFRSVADQEQLIDIIGVKLFRDISYRPDIRQLDTQDPLPGHFDRKSYQYCDGRAGRGVLEVVFTDAQLVNVRAHYFLQGWRAKKKGGGDWGGLGVSHQILTAQRQASSPKAAIKPKRWNKIRGSCAAVSWNGLAAATRAKCRSRSPACSRI